MGYLALFHEGSEKAPLSRSPRLATGVAEQTADGTTVDGVLAVNALGPLVLFQAFRASYAIRQGRRLYRE